MTNSRFVQLRVQGERADKVTAFAKILTAERGYHVPLEGALAEIIDSFSLPNRSLEKSKSIVMTEQPQDQPVEA